MRILQPLRLMGVLAKFRPVIMLLHLLVLAVILTAADAQLLDADECEIGYQYRPPPEELRCRENITLTRLNCLVAFPTNTPINTRVEVRWYWRSLMDAAAGSNTARQVDDSIFMTVNTVCNREEICPNLVNNLTVSISQLETESFSSTLQGDYMCRLLLINKTSDEVQQALHPSACVKLLLADSINQNCHDSGEREEWMCADTEQQTGQCPQLFSQYPVTLASSSVIQKSSSILVINSFQSSTSFYAGSISTVHSPPKSHSAVVISIPSSITTTAPTPGTPTGQHIILYISVSLGAFIIAMIGAVSTTVVIIICIQKRNTKRPTQNGRAPTFVLEDTHLKSSSENGDAVQDDGPTNEYTNGSGKEVKRMSSIYSKPVWPTEQKTIDPKNHKYAKPATPDKDEQRNSGVYSYAYQHHMHLRQGTEGVEIPPKGSDGYQKIGNLDYVQMYSNPSPLLVGKNTKPNHGIPEEKEYEQLNKETLSIPSPQTEAIQGPATAD